MTAEQSDTIIGAGVELKGSLHNNGTIHIYGKVTGDVSSESLVLIGETAIVTGPVKAKQVDVAGQVIGPITAHEQIELQPKSMVKGDLSTNRLSIKPGAIFIGKSQMQSDNAPLPPEESPDKKQPHLEIE